MTETAVVLIRALHVLYVALLATAPLFLIGGAILGLRRLTGPGLRRVHLAAIAFAGAQLIGGWSCPLTVLEAQLTGDPGPFRSGAPTTLSDLGMAHVIGIGIYAVASITAHAIARRASRSPAPTRAAA